MRRSVLQEFSQFVKDEEETTDLVRRASSLEGLIKQLRNRVALGCFPAVAWTRDSLMRPITWEQRRPQVTDGRLQTPENREL